MKRSGKVFIKDKLAGFIRESEGEFSFEYDKSYLKNPIHGAVSKTLPLSKNVFTDKNVMPFFDGLIPEGWLLNVAVKNWKLDPRDRMGLLLTICKDCIGAVSIVKIEND